MIDVVYTWVDCNDGKWRKDFESCLEIAGKKPAPSSSHPCRFRDYGELFYSLLSIEKFAHWVNKIFIVKKAYQFPDINDLPQRTKGKIVWVDERDLRPPELAEDAFNPTFNSLAIEANLHRIPELSEKFIYFNNDMFIGNMLSPDYFFENNALRLSLNRQKLWVQVYKKLMGNSKLPFIKGHWRHVMNAIELFDKEITPVKKLGISYTSTPVHQCFPIFKSGYQLAWGHAEIKKKLLANSSSKFRSDDNVHPVFLVSLINLWRGNARIYKEEDIFIQLNKVNYKEKLDSLTRERAFRFCVNDHPGNNNSTDTTRIIREFMHNYFYNSPRPAVKIRAATERERSS